MTDQKKSIWIAEDSDSYLFIYQMLLDLKYDTKYFKSLQEIKAALQSKSRPDLFIVDIKLEDGYFTEFSDSEEFQLIGDTPYIVVSSVEDIDILRYFYQKGAIDYVIKPFKKIELQAKIERITSLDTPAVNPKDKRDDPIFNDITEELPEDLYALLTFKEYTILKVLSKSPERTANRHTILEKVWKGVSVSPKTLDVHLYNLRKKIRPFGLNVRALKNGDCILDKS